MIPCDVPDGFCGHNIIIKEEWAMSVTLKNIAGVDVAKHKFDIALWAWKMGLEFDSLPSKEFPRTLKGARQFVSWSRKKLKSINTYVDFEQEPFHVVMDSTGRYSMELAEWIAKVDSRIEVSIVNSYKLHHYRKSLGQVNKTDRIDAAAHARYGFERKPKPLVPKEDVYNQLKGLIRQRKALQKDLIAAKARTDEPLTPAMVRKVQNKHVRFLEKQIEMIEKSIDELFSANPKLKGDKKLLETIPGVGKITIFTVLGELGDLRSYKTSRALSAMSGLAPKIFESGVIKGVSVISRKGSKYLRSGMYMPALVATQGSNQFQRKYDELRAKGKSHKSALCAIMRKMLMVMRALLINGDIYQDNVSKRLISQEMGPVENQ